MLSPSTLRPYVSQNYITQAYLCLLTYHTASFVCQSPIQVNENLLGTLTFSSQTSQTPADSSYVEAEPGMLSNVKYTQLCEIMLHHQKKKERRTRQRSHETRLWSHDSPNSTTMME